MSEEDRSDTSPDDEKLAATFRVPGENIFEHFAKSRIVTITPPLLTALPALNAVLTGQLGFDASIAAALLSVATALYSARAQDRLAGEVTLLKQGLKDNPPTTAIDPAHQEEWLNVLVNGMRTLGLKAGADARRRVREVLLHGIRAAQPPDRAALFLEIASKLSDADVAVLAAIAACYDSIKTLRSEHSDHAHKATEEARLISFVESVSARDPLSRDVLGREGLVPPENEKETLVTAASIPFEVTPLGRELLLWSKCDNPLDVEAA